MDSDITKIILQKWLDSSDIDKAIFLQILSKISSNLNTDNNILKMRWTKDQPRFPGNSSYPWGNRALFNRPAAMQQPLPHFFQFPGPPQRFPGPRMPPPRMPYYQQYPPPHRPLPAASGPRPGPSRQQPFHRNHPPRRRHHLDDIFLPNHDDEECPEAGFRPRYSRPPVRFEVNRTTHSKTVTSPASATTSNARTLSENVSDLKSTERTIINSNDKTKDKLELGKKIESDKLNVQQCINTVVKISDSNKTCELAKTINDAKYKITTCKDQRVSSHEKVIQLSDAKEKTIDKAKLNKNNEHVKSNVQSVVKNSNSSKTFSALNSVVPTTNDKKIETKTNIINNKIILTTNTELTKNNQTQTNDNPSRKSIGTTSKEVDINKTRNVNKVLPKPSTCSLEKGKVTHQKTDELQTSQNILHDKKYTMVSSSTNNKTNCEEQIVNIHIKKGSNGNQIEKQLQGDVHSSANDQTRKNIFKPTNDAPENGNNSFSPKDKSSKDIDRLTILDRKPQANKNTDQNSSTLGNKVSESKTNVNKKGVKVKLFKNDGENKDHKKLQDNNGVTDSITKSVIQQISKDKTIKKADKPKDVQERVCVPEQNIDNSVKATTLQLNNGDKSVNSSTQICTKDQTSNDLEIDIVKELEALVNKRDDYALREIINTEGKEIDNKPKSKDKNLNSTYQDESLEEGSFTQGTTRVVAPSSPQAIKKDIIIKLIRTPQPKSPLVADKSPQSKDPLPPYICSPFPTSPLAPCNRSPVLTSPLTTNARNKNVKKSDVHTDRQHITTRVSGINTDDNSNNPILEDIYILEDALKIIDNPPEIIEVPSSPPTKDDATNDSRINKRGVKDDEIIDLDDVQIIEQQHATIEIFDDDNNDDDVTSTTLNDCHNKSTTPIVVIKDESPVDRDRVSKCSTWHDRPPEDFGTLDTRGSFLFTFHQRFDDPRVVDMDICHTPSPPAQSEQQKESDRVIKDMDALWSQISENKDNECSSERPKDGKGMIESNKDIENATVLTGNRPLGEMPNKKVKNYQQCEELRNTAFENQNRKGHNSRVICANQDLNTIVQDAFNKKVKRSAMNHPRRASFSHKNSDIHSFNISLRKTKSLSDIDSIITVNSDFFVAPALRNVIADFTHTKTTTTETNLLQNIISESSCHRKCSIDGQESSVVADYEDEQSSLLSSSKHKDQISDKGICVKHIAIDDCTTLGICKKLDVIPKTVPNNLITADRTDDSDGSIQTKRNGVKNIKKKRVRRIESSDEESTEVTARILKKDEPKEKKQKLQVKPTRKRKIALDDKAKSKEFKKYVEASRTSPVSKKCQAESSKTDKFTASSRKKVNHSSPEKLSVPATQPLTKYVTKAEYIKSFARSHSLIPNISLSIQPISKTQKIKQRRATFTCEADNETILKKVDGGERCKQKFRDLFGSVSEDEDDLIQVPSTEVCKTPCEADKNVEETHIIPDTRTVTITQSNKKDNDKKRKRSSSKSFIEETDSPNSSRVSSSPKTALLSDHNLLKPLKTSKIHNINSNKGSDNCKRLKMHTQPTVQIEQKISDGKRLIKNRKTDNEKSKANDVDNKDSKKIDLGNRRESTSSTDSRSRDSCCQALGEEKISLGKTQIKPDARISRSRSKESDSSRKATNVDNDSKYSNKKVDLDSRRESTSSTDSRSRDSSWQALREQKNSPGKTQMKTEGRISRSRSKESDSSRNATNVNNNKNKDSNKKVDLDSRRESTSSTDSRSRESGYQALREETKIPGKTQMKMGGRISRSRTKESDSSRISDADKHILKNDHSKEEKRKKASDERSFDKGCSKSLKFKQHASKGESLQQERTYCDYRRDSTSSVESNTSGPNHRKKESIDKKILKSNLHRREPLSKDITMSGNGKETSTDALNQNHEVKQTSCTDSGSSRAVIKRCELIKEGKKENVTEHKGYPKPGLDEKNKDYNSTQGTKTFTKNKSLLVESDYLDKHVTEPSRDTSVTEHKEQRKLVAQELRATDIKGSPIKKIMETFRRNSAPDVLSSSSETSLIIGEIEDLPLLYRASEGELNEQFQICQAYTPQVIKRDKITKLSVVDAECIDRVHISDPPEICTDMQTIKQTYKDDDVIEIRPVIPMIDLTEEDIRINRESSPKETLADLILEAKKEIEELSHDQATITLYRSEEDNSNQDQEVQAIAASIPIGSQKQNYSQIKKDKDLLQQDTTIASSSEITLQASSNKNMSNNIEITVFDNNLNPSLPNVEKETPEAASPAAPQLTAHGTTIAENSLPKSSNVETPQPPAIPPLSLDDENQRAVSSILDIQQNIPSSRVITDSVDDLHCSTNQCSTILQSTFETLIVNTVNESLNVDNFQPAEQDNNLDKQDDPTTTENPNTISEPHEVSRSIQKDGTAFDKDNRPRIIVKPTVAEKHIAVDPRILNVGQDQMVQEDSFGQHKGLPQTLREYRPSRRVRVACTVVPPALVNINLSRTSPQKKKNKGQTKQTSSQDVGNSPTQNTEVDNNQTSRQRAPENHQSFVDLTQENGELSTMDLRLIVDIFTRHAFFLVHLCEAQNRYIEYLQKQSFCPNYFRAEIALFEEQRQARLLSQSLRLITELQNLNIRATRNLSGSASEIVEQIAVNLVNRDMPTQVSRSMVYLLIAKLIKPQSDIFSRVPLLKALIRICNVVLSRIVSRYPNLSENQRQILTHQVEEYNRLFGGPSWPPNQVNTNLSSIRPNLQQSTSTNPLTTDVPTKDKSVRSVQSNQSMVRNILPRPGNRDDLLGNQGNSRSGQSGLQVPPMNSQLPASVRKPAVNSNNLPSIVRLEHQFGSPRQLNLNSSGGSVIETRNVYSGPPNVSLGLNTTTPTESLPTIHQASIGRPNLMTPSNGNRMIPPNANVPTIRQHRFSSPRQSSPFVVPNKPRQMMNSVRAIRDLPGGANTNTLGCTPRYLPNYEKSIPSNVYAPLGRPRHPSVQNLDSVPRNTSPLNNCSLFASPSSSNSQIIRGLLSNQNNSDRHTSNSMLATLLADKNASSQGSPIVQQNSVPQSPRCNNNSEPKILQDNNITLESPRCNLVTQTPRRNAASQRSPGRLPSYEESIALKSIHQSSSSLPNHLSPDEAKKRNENLLKELLSTPDNDPFFGRSSSPANDNFRIKLPFTQPDTTRSITTSAVNTLSTFNDNASSSFLTCQSNMPLSSTGVSTFVSQASNITPIASELLTVVVTSSQPIMQNNPVVVYTPPTVQCHQPNMISLSSQSVTSLAPIVWVNNTVASTSYVVAQPKQTVILNQGLEALSSIGPASAMLNFPSNYIANSQSTTNSLSITSMQSQALSIANQPLFQGSNAFQTVAPIAILNNSTVSQPQNLICLNNAVGDNQTYVSIQHQPSPPVVNVAAVDDGKTSALGSPFSKFKLISKQTPNKAKTKMSKPKSKTKSKPPKKRRPGKQKKGALTKAIEIIDLLSSDEDMTAENQSGMEERASEEAEDSNVTIENSKQDTTDSQAAAIQQPCGSKASLSTSDTQNQDQESPAQTNESSNLQSPSTQAQLEDLQPSTSNSSNRLEGTNEEDEVETIDLTWIDEMDDEELQREMDFVFIKKEEHREENEEAREQNNMVVPSPADSGISSPPVQSEDDTTVYTVNVQRLCICSKTAQYNCVCGEAWYCGQDCQLKDWSSHQKVCQIYHEAMDTEEELMANEQDVDTRDETT